MTQLDSLHAISQQLANPFVASVIGSPPMNFLTLPCDSSLGTFGEASLTPLQADPTLMNLSLFSPKHLHCVSGEGFPVRAEVILVGYIGMNHFVGGWWIANKLRSR